MKTTINLTPEEALRCESGDTFTFARPLIKQPPDCYNKPVILDNKYVEFIHTRTTDPLNIPLQYPVGAKLGMRETWGYNSWICSSNYKRFNYRADHLHPSGKWKSPVTMPAEAIRNHVTIISNTVQRVQDVAYQEWRAMFPETSEHFIATIIDYWNSLYAKKGLSWESDPYIELCEGKVK